jgi:predicted type IV restriction endonuclease
MKNLDKKQVEDLLNTLKCRFEENIDRHKNIAWNQVENKLIGDMIKLLSLNEMEKTGGEPDVVLEEDGSYIFYDCSKESPNRRSFCYDREALESRKKFPPTNNVIDVAREMGIEILNENEYRYLQTLGDFDLKTSSWIKTPAELRTLGGALFGDKRYDRTFIYHNGADSYYESRGFRGSLKI